MATTDEQAMEFLLQSDQSDADFWQSTGAKLAKGIGTQVSRLVERRLIYAASMSVAEAVSLHRYGDEVHGALKDSEDQSTGCLGSCKYRARLEVKGLPGPQKYANNCLLWISGHVFFTLLWGGNWYGLGS